MWTNDQLRLLINERKSRNIEYHNIFGSSRVDFWNEIANKINEEFRTNYTDHQCKDKFRNLVNSHNSLCRYVVGNRTGRRTRVAERYFDEFRSRFWERPETQFDQIHNVNRSSRRREERQRSRTPPPSYEEVSSMLDLREFSTSQRGRSRSPRRVSNDSRRNININQSNQGFEIDIQNMGSRIPVLAENISDNSNIENNVQEDNDR
ncbi:8230_t:CDS:2 [Entrophospora sp. SA101]|nr:8230_t:CDS:2 [Entrophospora sp. SA101]